MNILKQSTAVDIIVGPFVDSTDGNTEETGLTIAQANVRLSKNGQTMAQKNDNTTCAHDANGMYNCELDATDTDTVGQLTVYIHVAGALAFRMDFQVIEEAIYDALYGASATGFDASGRVDVGKWIGTAVTLSATSTKPEVDVKSISDDATAANNAESFFDGTGYAGTGNVIPTVTTLTGHTAQTGDAYARLGAPAGASVSADVAAVKVDTAAILVDTGTTLDAKIDVIDGIVDSILVDTAEIGAAGAGLTAIASAASISALNNLSAAQVNAEVVDVLTVDTYASDLTAPPAATSTILAKLSWLFMLGRNKRTSTSTQEKLYKDDATTVAGTSTVSDDGTTATRGEYA